MPEPVRIPLAETTPGQRVANCVDRRWFVRLALLQSNGPQIEHRTAEREEGVLLVISGTHDLAAGPSSWASRGARSTPFDGRPVAVFAPPRTLMRTSGGNGELLVVTARQPKPTATTPAEPVGLMPLLPIAGSNKVFDRQSGNWQPLESLPGSAEAILPRRIEQEQRPGVRIERVMPLMFKAAGLTLLEAMLEPGAEFTLPDREGTCRTHPEEWAVYWRGNLTLHTEGRTARLAGDGVMDGVLVGDGPATLRANDGRAYLVVAGAGVKPA